MKLAENVPAAAFEPVPQIKQCDQRPTPGPADAHDTAQEGFSIIQGKCSSELFLKPDVVDKRQNQRQTQTQLSAS